MRTLKAKTVNRMRFPNGYGSITYKNDKPRRRPYAVRKFIDGKQKLVASAASFEDALSILVSINSDPSVLNCATVTFTEIFKLTIKEKEDKITAGTLDNYASVYKHCTPLYDLPFAKIKTADLQAVIQTVADKGLGYSTQKKTRQLFHAMYTYAIKYELLSNAQDKSLYVDLIDKQSDSKKKPFTTRQLNRVRALADSDNPLSRYAKCVVMMCYCGTRPSEFINIKREDVKLRQRYFVVRESKTAAGRNRIVPISRKTLDYFAWFMSEPGKTTLIVADDGSSLNYMQFKAKFDQVMEACKCDHNPHECRHTCATWLDNANANDVATKKILGHACQGVTKGVYTHKSLHELKKAIDLL